MNRKIALLLLSLAAVAWVGALSSQTAKPAKPPPPSVGQKPSYFWQRVLRFTGISINAATLKGTEVLAGQVWVVDLRSGTRTRTTASGGYRSPLFIPGSTELLALKGMDVMRIASPELKPHKLYTIDGVSKLVSFGADDPDQVLLLKEDDAGRVSVHVFALQTGKLTPLAYDTESKEDEQMLESLQGWQRTYGDKTVYVKHVSKQAMSGPVEWSEVFLKLPGADSKDVSHCDGVDCGQPSLSADGARVAFIMKDP
jgi:hypothetical protein